MPRRANITVTTVCSLAALVELMSGHPKPAGVRTAFELIAGHSGSRQAVNAQRTAILLEAVAVLVPETIWVPVA